jgi:hypothetical protein
LHHHDVVRAGWSDRHDEREGRALAASFTGRCDGSPMQLDEVTDDRETEPKAPMPTRRRGILLTEPIEHVREEVRIDAVPRITDDHHQ